MHIALDIGALLNDASSIGDGFDSVLVRASDVFFGHLGRVIGALFLSGLLSEVYLTHALDKLLLFAVCQFETTSERLNFSVWPQFGL